MHTVIDKDNFEEITNEGVTLVDFWAPWCGPCRMIAPVIDELAEEYKDKAVIGKVNTDENQELAAKYGVRSIPFIMFMKDGKMVDSMVGAASKDAFKEKLDAVLGL